MLGKTEAEGKFIPEYLAELGYKDRAIYGKW